MRLAAWTILSLGLSIGLFLGCKGSDGIQGLCETIHACGGDDGVGACVLDLSQCDNAENDANYCLDLNGCAAYEECLGKIRTLCGMNPDTGDDPDTGALTTGTPDDSTTNVDPSTTSGSVDPTTTADPDTSTGEPDPSTSSPDQGTTETSATGDPIAACKAEIDPPTPCHDCICDKCYENYQACVDDEGCTAIRVCAEETGCTGLDCLDTCGPVIDMYGGFLGMSAKIGLDLNQCLGDNCMMECANG